MSYETLPRELRHLRACLGCSLVKTWEQFESDGCENCEPWMGMRGSRAAVLDCTSSSFEGLIGLASPSESWVARWQWLRGQAVGMYAISVAGRLPGHVLRQMKAKGKEYKSRDTATK